MFGVEFMRDRHVIERATIIEDDFRDVLTRARDCAAALPEQPNLIHVIDRDGTGLGFYPVDPSNSGRI